MFIIVIIDHIMRSWYKWHAGSISRIVYYDERKEGALIVKCLRIDASAVLRASEYLLHEY